LATPEEMPAVYVVLEASGLSGVKVAAKLALSYATVPATSVPSGPLSTTVDSLTVDKFICWLNVAATMTSTLTSVAPSAGTVETTAGIGSTVPEPLPHPTAVASKVAPTKAIVIAPATRRKSESLRIL